MIHHQYWPLGFCEVWTEEHTHKKSNASSCQRESRGDGRTAPQTQVRFTKTQTISEEWSIETEHDVRSTVVHDGMNGAATTMFSYQFDSPTALSPRGPAAVAALPEEEMWVTATWMPHSSLSQSSHVSLGLRSIHAILDSLTSNAMFEADEWRVQVAACGMAGLTLVPVVSSSTASPIVSIRESKLQGVTHPSVSRATHHCVLDQVLQVPIRWRDLPRDAYLLIEVVGKGDDMVRYCTSLAICVCMFLRASKYTSTFFVQQRYLRLSCPSLMPTASFERDYSV